MIESLSLERSPDNTRFVGGSKKSYWSKFLIKNFSCICAAVLKILKSSKQERILSVCLTIRGGERGRERVCQSLYYSPGPPCSKVTFYIKALVQYTKRIFWWGLPWWSISARCAILRINYIWNWPFVYWAGLGKGNRILCFLPVNWRRIQNLLPRARTWGSVWLLCVDTEIGGSVFTYTSLCLHCHLSFMSGLLAVWMTTSMYAWIKCLVSYWFLCICKVGRIYLSAHFLILNKKRDLCNHKTCLPDRGLQFSRAHGRWTLISSQEKLRSLVRLSLLSWI